MYLINGGRSNNYFVWQKGLILISITCLIKWLRGTKLLNLQPLNVYVRENALVYQSVQTDGSSNKIIFQQTLYCSDETSEDEGSQDKGLFPDLRSTGRSPSPKKRILIMKPFKYVIVLEDCQIVSLEKYLTC